MVKRFWEGGKTLFYTQGLKTKLAGDALKQIVYSKQTNILSAATVIMVMVLASRILGLVRNRTFVHFFPPEKLDSFLAAFQVPDLIFEILILGAMSSAFIPVFTGYMSKNKQKEAWYVAGITLNILLICFAFFSILIFIFAQPIYELIAKGFTPDQIKEIVVFTRYLLIAQMFFVASYLLTAVLESHQRFLISAIAPLFYNLGIILATVLLAPSLGLIAPVIGVVLGSAMHFLVQLPLAMNLGFKPVYSLNFRDPGVRKIGKLAIPRLIELSFFQVKRLTDLFVASFVVGGLTYFKFGDSLAALPVGLFGLSIAKASLPQLSKQAGLKNLDSFKATFSSSFKEILFLVIPASIFVAVLRLPLVRLAYGAAQFDWQDTLETGYVVSAFAFGIFAYSLSLLASRAFYALQDTTTPVKISMLTILINAILGLFFIVVLQLPIWGLPLAYSIAGIFQILILMFILSKKVKGFAGHHLAPTFGKIIFAAGSAGLVMFILLKILDRSAWDQKLSFLGHFGLALPTTFDRFILDTRYTVNLIFVTAVVAAIGVIIYLLLCYLFKVEELKLIAKAVRRVTGARLRIPLISEPAKHQETISSPPSNGV